jgi:hypothetical protein
MGRWEGNVAGVVTMAAKRVGQRSERIREEDLSGFHYLEVMRKLLGGLHDVGCQRDRAGNRELHFDQYCLLVLLFLFNPVCRSLRAIQQASELRKVQKRLGCSRASLGSLSEATDVFDAERLRSIVEELAARLTPNPREAALKDVRHTLTLVDGTLLSALPSMAQAAWLKQETGSGLVRWRLHTHFEVDRSSPRSIDLTDGSGRGEADERDVLARRLAPDHCYVMDRGYAKFELFNAIHALGSSYVCRIRDNSHWQTLESRTLESQTLESQTLESQTLESQTLTPDDVAAGVIGDERVQLGNRTSTSSPRTDHAIRIVQVAIAPHPKRGKTGGGSAGHPSDGVLRLATNLLDVPAHVIALLYRYRWTIEIFFRFFKHVLGCRHLLSHDAEGIRIQTYCAIIACLLISLWTGRKPSLRTYEMICYYFSGLASEDELIAHLSKLPPHART